MSSSMEKEQTSKPSEYKENLELLRQIPLFSAMSLEALKVFAYLCARETFKRGDYLFYQNDNDGKAFYIVSGSAELVLEDEAGELRFRKYSDGEFLGGLILLGDMRRLFSLRALTDITCLTLTRDRFIKAMGQFPDHMPRVLKTMVERVRDWEERLLSDREGYCDRYKEKAGVSLI